MAINLSTAPFSSTSDWNQLVSTGATYTSLNWPAATGYNYEVTWSHDSPGVYVASSSDPLVTVTGSSGWGWPNTVSINIPAGVTGAVGGVNESNPDKPLLVIEPDGTVYNFWHFNRTSNTTATADAWGESNYTTGTGWGTSSQGAGIVAAGASELGGLLVQAQTDTGTINHALQLALNSSLLAPGYVSPAVGGDGRTSGAPVQEGDLLAIPKTATMPSGLSTLGQEVFRALQNYGAYVTDNGTDTTALRAQANAYSAATMSALQTDLNSILPMLDKVTGGTPSGPGPSSGGTTTPPVPPAAPSITGFSPDSGVTGDQITNATQLTLNGTAVAGSTVTVSDDTTKLGTATASSTGAWTFATATLGNGAHSFTATDTTSSGTSSASSAYAVTIDTHTPVAPTGLADAAISGGYVNAATDTTTQKLTGTAEAGSTVTVSDGTTKLGTATTDSTGAFSFTLGHLADGSHSLTATATDVAGTPGAASAPLAFTVDTQAPSAPVETGASIVTGTTEVLLTGTAEASSTVNVSDAGKLVGTVAANASGAWSLTTGNLAAGSTLNYTATATDAAGNTSVASAVQTVTIPPASPPPPPQTPPAAPTLAAYSQAGVAVSGSTTLTDLVLKGGAVAGSTVTVDDGTKELGTTTASSAGAWSYDTGALALGSHSFTATDTTSAGTSAASAADAVTVAAPPLPPPAPTAPTLTVASNSLYVSPGGSIQLGLGVSVPNAGDNVTVNISGLPKYETITAFDGTTSSGSSGTFTAAEVNSGLSLSSSYRGHGRPTATLTVTATDSTGTPMTSAAQTIRVVDPPATTTTSSTSTTTSSTSTTSGDRKSWGQSHHRIDVAQWFNNHPDFAHAATTLSEAGASNSGAASSTTTTAPTTGVGAKAYALLNQMMAGDFGRESHFAQAATALSASSRQQANLLTRPLH